MKKILNVFAVTFAQMNASLPNLKLYFFLKSTKLLNRRRTRDKLILTVSSSSLMAGMVLMDRLMAVIVTNSTDRQAKIFPGRPEWGFSTMSLSFPIQRLWRDSLANPLPLSSSSSSSSSATRSSSSYSSTRCRRRRRQHHSKLSSGTPQ